MKKIALFSDIHSGYMGLDIILNYASKRGADEFIFAGDYVSDGPEPEEVIQRVREMKGYFIRGNRKDYMLAYDQGLANEWDTSLQCAPLLWTYNRLIKAALNSLRHFRIRNL